MRLSSCCGPVRCALVHPSSPAPVCFISLCCTSLCAAPPLPPSSPVAFPSLQVRCIHLEYRARPHNQALTEAAPPPPPTSLSLFSFHPAILPLCSRASVPAVPFFLCPVCVYLLTAGPPCLPLALASCTAISTTDSCARRAHSKVCRCMVPHACIAPSTPFVLRFPACPKTRAHAWRPSLVPFLCCACVHRSSVAPSHNLSFPLCVCVCLPPALLSKALKAVTILPPSLLPLSICSTLLFHALPSTVCLLLPCPI